MSDSLLQRSVTTAVARNLATTSKTRPMMMSITPRHCSTCCRGCRWRGAPTA